MCARVCRHYMVPDLEYCNQGKANLANRPAGRSISRGDKPVRQSMASWSCFSPCLTNQSKYRSAWGAKGPGVRGQRRTVFLAAELYGQVTADPLGVEVVKDYITSDSGSIGYQCSCAVVVSLSLSHSLCLSVSHSLSVDTHTLKYKNRVPSMTVQGPLSSS